MQGTPDKTPTGKLSSWPEFWARAVADCVERRAPIPTVRELRDEYIARGQAIGGLQAWAETNTPEDAA